MATAHEANSAEKQEASLNAHLEDKHDTKTSPGAAAHRPSVAQSAAERARQSLNAKLANPLMGFSYNELKKMGRAYAYEHALAEPEDVRALEIGACLARNPGNVDDAKLFGVNDEELAVLERELSHRWSQPFTLYLVIVLCSICAAVQGMGKLLLSLQDMPLTNVRFR